MKQTTIVGAGLAGLIAACVFKDAPIFEAGQQVENHKALLRFRDESVSTVTGIPFRAVKVHKEIIAGRQTMYQANNCVSNMYSMKVTGRLGDRSIRNLDPVTRYVAPHDFYQRLVDAAGDRIRWNSPLQARDFEPRGNVGNIISTMPLNLLCEMLGIESLHLDFDKKPIAVRRYRLPEGSDVYQTNYYPSPFVRTYRSSITGDILIIESIENVDTVYEMSVKDEIEYVFESFGIHREDATQLGDATGQKFGKIVDLDRREREGILHELTARYNIFSLGRFATWRNILLDDVVKDIEVLKRIMAANDYGRRLIASA